VTFPTAPFAPAPAGSVVCLCHGEAGRALLEGGLLPHEIHGSAVEALLAAARQAPEAVVLQFEANGRTVHEKEVLAAFRRAHAGVPIYGLVSAEAEPAARRLLGRGLTDYFVLPAGAAQLLAVLHGRAEPGPSVSEPMATAAAPAFEAACRLADLALAQPLPLFADGARIIVEACGTGRGCAFRWAPAENSLELAFNRDGDDTLGGGDPATLRSAVVRCLQTSEVLVLPGGTRGLPPEGLTCLPVRDEQARIGVVCLTAADLSPGAVRQAESLTAILARLYRGADRREEYARLALRDAETGLLKADPFLTYVDSRIAQATDRQEELALILVQPAADRADTVAGAARLGLAVKQALAHDWEGGRLKAARYAVAVPAHTASDRMGDSPDTVETAARQLAEAAPKADGGTSVQTGVARFPADGDTAHALLAAAEQHLSQPGPSPNGR